MGKKTVEYVNRYGDRVIFTLIDENTIKMEGGVFVRIGWITEEDYNNKKYSMVDPSGGPYISSGCNMGIFNKYWNKKIIDYVTLENDYYLIKIRSNEIRE